MGSLPQPPYPLHESVAGRLDPEYVKFYNKHIIHQQQIHFRPIHVSRAPGMQVPGGGPLQPVGSTKDILIHRSETEGPDIKIRVFTPRGTAPRDGWPVVVYYHGGGWVLGDLDSENTVCTHLCARAKCLVITVDYRLAPENPFPAAVHDAWEALLWVKSTGHTLLGLDLTKVAISGTSAGGNLAATMCHKAVSAPSLAPQIKLQLLIVPVTDNTANPGNNWSYEENEFTAALSAEKMIWYRSHYLPDRQMWSHPEASPLLSPHGWEDQPKALIVLAELDILKGEGKHYAEKLMMAGVEVSMRVIKGMPHTFTEMDEALHQGRDTITDMVVALREEFSAE